MVICMRGNFIKGSQMEVGFTIISRMQDMRVIG